MRSLSNVIKSYVVRYEEAAFKAIDNHLSKEAEIQVRRNLKLTQTVDKDGFVEGINAPIVEQVNMEENSAEVAEKLLEAARIEAKTMIDAAKLEAEQIKADALAKANKQGYDEGMMKSQKELQDKRRHLDAERIELHKEYEAKIIRLEPEMADIMSSLITKITGVLVEDQWEVILHLVERAFHHLDKINYINLRVGNEDYEYLLSKKEYLMGIIGREIELDITEDPTLKKNQCLIETEQKVIDCSLDVQLTNLIADIKLLGNV